MPCASGPAFAIGFWVRSANICLQCAESPAMVCRAIYGKNLSPNSGTWRTPASKMIDRAVLALSAATGKFRQTKADADVYNQIRYTRSNIFVKMYLKYVVFHG